MLVLTNRKCLKCKQVFVTWTGGVILKDPFTLFHPCPHCKSILTRPIK